MTTIGPVTPASTVNLTKSKEVGLASFVPTGRAPAAGPRGVEFEGTLDGKSVRVSLSPPGSTFWKGNFSVWVNGSGRGYEESRALAGALRKAGWSEIADLIAKVPTAKAPFADFSEVKITKSTTGAHGTLLNTGEFVLSGKLAPDSVGTVRYQPTADGQGKVFLGVEGGALAGRERELSQSERAQLAERLAHTFQATQAAPFISKQGYDAWDSNVPGRDDFPGPPVNPWVGAWQYYANRMKEWSNWTTR